MLLPHVTALLACAEGKPAAAALTFVHDGTAGVYWVGTIEAYRRRGLATALVREITNAGFDMGARISTLQATVMGEPVYRKLGYETVFITGSMCDNLIKEFHDGKNKTGHQFLFAGQSRPL